MFLSFNHLHVIGIFPISDIEAYDIIMGKKYYHLILKIF